MTILKTRYVVVMLITALALGSCNLTTNRGLEQVTEAPLRVGWHPWPGYFPLVLANELDLFSKHGVRVEVLFFEGSSFSHPKLQAGELDAATGTLADALLMDGQQPGNVRVVLTADYSFGGDVIVATSDIGTVADLRGKSIGANLGSFSELFVLEMLRANGLTVDDVTLVNVEARDVPSTMPQTIQAGHTWEPQTSEALAKGYHIIFSSADTPGLIPDLIIFRSAVVRDRPNDVKAFVAAWLEAAAFWEANPDEGNKIIANALERDPTTVSLAGLKLFLLEDNRHAFTPGPDTTSLYKSSELNAQFLINSGGLNDAPDINRLLDPSFLPEQ